MYDENKHAVADRIVNFSQSHLCPMPSGKTGHTVEFGSKVLVSVVGGDAYLDKVGFDNYNESKCLGEQIKAYRRRIGFYSERVLADKIYQNNENRKCCKAREVELM